MAVLGKRKDKSNIVETPLQIHATDAKGKKVKIRITVSEFLAVKRQIITNQINYEKLVFAAGNFACVF